jgi:hypothetical protein
MSEQKFINAVGNIRDEYLLEALPKGQRKKKAYIIISRVAAAMITLSLIGSLSINVFLPVHARGIPFIGSVFAYIQDNLDFAGIYSNYAFEVGDTVSDNGLTVTMSEAYCDGVNLYVSFIVESDEPFSSFTTGNYIKRQLNYYGETYIESKEGRKSLDDFGLAGLEGEFTDDFTFVGVEIFSLEGDTFPDEFVLYMKMNSISLLPENTNNKIVRGDWRFTPTVEVNTEDVVTYEINKEENGHTIDKVVVSPIMVTIYTSYPDIYYETTNYEVRTYTDGGDDEDISSQGIYDATSGITRIPRYRINKNMHIYVLDWSTLCKTGFERGTQAESKEHAIVWADVTID